MRDAAAHPRRRRQRPTISRSCACALEAQRLRGRHRRRRRGGAGRASRQLEPDLILLDIMMPKLDGIEVCRRLKADTRCPSSRSSWSPRRPTRRTSWPASSRRRRLPDQAGRHGRADGARALDAAHQGAARHGAGAGRSGAGGTGTARSSSGSPSRSARLERISRLQRFLAPQVAELIVVGRRREHAASTTAARSRWCSATCAASPPSPRPPSPRR